MKTLTDWIRETHDLACEKGWWEDFPPGLGQMRIPEALANIHAEVSEAWECYRSDSGIGVRWNGEPSFSKPEGFTIELADIVIRIFDLAGGLGIDLESAIKAKHEYNKTRPYRHGGKRA